MDKRHSISASPSTPPSQRRSRVPVASSRLPRDVQISKENDTDAEIEARSQESQPTESQDDNADGLIDTTTRAEDGDDAEDDAEDGSEDEEENPGEESDIICQYTNPCNTGSRDFRKVISHVFGRNKKCTTQIPNSCWIIYCRKHYQRTRYRTNKAGVNQYFNVQFDSLSRQLTRMQVWGGVESFTIEIRKKEKDLLNAENEEISQLRESRGTVDGNAVNRIQRCPERFLLAYTGHNKTFDEVRHVIQVMRREVERLGMTQLPGVEFLPNIDRVKYPPKKAQKNKTTRDSASHSRKRGNPSSGTSGARSSSGAAKRRRLVRGPRVKLESDEDMDIDDEMELRADGTSLADSSPAEEMETQDQEATPERAKTTSNSARTTLNILEEGWYPKEEHLKAPRSSSTTPKVSNGKHNSLRKEATNRSAAKQRLPRGSNKPDSPEVRARQSETRDDETGALDTSRPSPLGYDPWPNSTRVQTIVHSIESGTPVSESTSKKARKVLKEDTHRSASSATTTPSSSSMAPTKENRKARITQQNVSKKSSSRYAVASSSPDEVAYRPATPKTPPSDESSTFLPEMRKFPTPQAPRSAAPLARRTSPIESTPTPEVSRTSTPNTKREHTSQASRASTSQLLLSSPTSLPHVSLNALGYTPPAKKRTVANTAFPKESDDEVELS